MFYLCLFAFLFVCKITQKRCERILIKFLTEGKLAFGGDQRNTNRILVSRIRRSSGRNRRLLTLKADL